MNMLKKSSKIKKMVIMAIFISIIIIQTLVPFLGFIPLGFMNATIIHITVIIGALLLGVKEGAGLGLFFGLASMWKNTFMPNPTSFCFSPFVYLGSYKSVIICLIPRILIGVVAYYTYDILKNKSGEKTSLFIAGAAGSLTNTILVMGGIYLFYAGEYAQQREVALSSMSYVIMGIIGTQGLLEAVVSAIITASVVTVLSKIVNE